MEPYSIAQSARRFESLCVSVLRERGYRDDTDIENYRNPDAADFVGTDPTTGKKIVAEFKLTISSQVRATFMEQAIFSLLRQRERFPDALLLLIISSPLPESWMVFIRLAGIQAVWDIQKLLSEASQTQVFAELQAFLNDLGVPRFGGLSEGPSALPDTFKSIPSMEPEKKGAKLCSQIKGVPSGKEGWNQFEKLCTDALIFLFGDQFGTWQRQSPSDDGLHRRDFLVRLSPQHDFWISLAHDFRSRYIVFEFKNYDGPIGQDEIYSTEKYLFTTALRSVAFIVARNGASEGAFRAASGALREAGKLIVIVSASDLCEMLDAKDQSEEPEIKLNAHLDKILTKMPR